MPFIGTATAMAWVLTQSGFSRQLAHAMTAMRGGGTGFMAVSIVAFVVLGSVLEGVPAIVLFGPLLFPSARAIGIHDVRYGHVVVLAMDIGLLTAPSASATMWPAPFAACRPMRRCDDATMRRIWPYLLAVLAGLVAVAAAPWFSVGFL